MDSNDYDTDGNTDGRGRIRSLFCGHCQQRCGPSGDDPCIENLPGVMNACCGHGKPERAYLQWRPAAGAPDSAKEDEWGNFRLGGVPAFDLMKKMKTPTYHFSITLDGRLPPMPSGEEEREAIVKWLRDPMTGEGDVGDQISLADEIENGDHLR